MKPPRDSGFTLLELVISMAVSAFLVLGLIGIASATSSSTRLQRNQAEIQEHARLAVNILSSAIRQAGFNPQPWSEDFPPLGITDDSLDGVSSVSDRLAVSGWSDLNCFGNRNPDEDPSGQPLFYFRESVFDMNSDHGLTRRCSYGPTPDDFTVQVPRQGFIQGVDAFQVLYGQDSDQDGVVDGWVRAGHWSDPADILGIRVGLLLSSQESVAEKESRTFDVLDTTVSKSGDGKMRRVTQITSAIKGRTD